MKRWIIAAALLVLDQLFKTLAQRYAAPGGLITLTKNTGITFGLLPGANTTMILVSLLAAAAIGYYTYKETMPALAGFVAILAGVLGNLSDRVVHGGVIDYLSIGSFPVFNLADALIVGGIIYLLLVEIPAVRRRLAPRTR